jgi:hypothetical protein
MNIYIDGKYYNKIMFDVDIIVEMVSFALFQRCLQLYCKILNVQTSAAGLLAGIMLK